MRNMANIGIEFEGMLAGAKPVGRFYRHYNRYGSWIMTRNDSRIVRPERVK